MIIINKSDDTEKINEKNIGFDVRGEQKQEFISTTKEPFLFKEYETPYLNVTEEELKELSQNKESFFARFKRKIKKRTDFTQEGNLRLAVYFLIIVPLFSHLIGFKNIFEILGYDSFFVGYFFALVLSFGFEFFVFLRTMILNLSKIESYGYILLSTSFSVLANRKFFINQDGSFDLIPFMISFLFYLGMSKTLHDFCVKLKLKIDENKRLAELRNQEKQKLIEANPSLAIKFTREKKIDEETKESILNFCLGLLGSREGATLEKIETAFEIKTTTATKFLNQAERLYNKKREEFKKTGKFIQPPNRVYSKREELKPKKSRNTSTMKAFTEKSEKNKEVKTNV